VTVARSPLAASADRRSVTLNTGASALFTNGATLKNHRALMPAANTVYLNL